MRERTTRAELHVARGDVERLVHESALHASAWEARLLEQTSRSDAACAALEARLATALEQGDEARRAHEAERVEQKEQASRLLREVMGERDTAVEAARSLERDVSPLVQRLERKLHSQEGLLFLSRKIGTERVGHVGGGVAPLWTSSQDSQSVQATLRLVEQKLHGILSTDANADAN